MFVDEIRIHVKSGKGGDGVVRWLHEKGKELSGPSGGNGGRGGSVYLEAIKDFTLLAKYRGVKEFKAEKGGDGMKNSRHGKDGEDFVVQIPVGSRITNLQTKNVYVLDKIGQKELVAEGGKGGKGNEFYKSSRNVSPDEFTLGEEGEEYDLLIELELFADAGLVGLPNAGKSSLLNSLTNTKARVADFPFTTIEPNLGEMYGFILADIPGLIEGASQGKGLGYKFLRHIKKTSLILHCISLENEDLKMTYDTVRKELEGYGNELEEKEEIIILTKSDVVDSHKLEKVVKEFAKKVGNRKIFTSSVIDDNSLKNLSKNILDILKSKS